MDSVENFGLENISLVDMIQDSTVKNMGMGKMNLWLGSPNHIDTHNGDKVDVCCSVHCESSAVLAMKTAHRYS